jgi:uncharacterized DUF497 family protein
MAVQRYTLNVAGFEWDDGNRLKCQKHGVSEITIESVFRGSIAVMPDPAHSKSEERFNAIGMSDDRRWIFLVFTLRTRHGRQFVRPISARFMHKKEVEHYEKETATLQKR